ncbi:MAG: CoA transferase [Actinomycetota bacterium]|jgi:crotonobetainyl-CoA:carnitine CoA-transferase CaiB-like acyl-CoA transferase|nr:CoA transferase [Actinomycetota bacterium]
MTAPLEGMKVVTLAVNVPGPAAAARLREFGADVVKVEPPGGDPLAASNPAWHEAMASGQEIVGLDLKDDGGRSELFSLLEEADLLLTSNRPASLARLGLSPEELREKYPRMSYVAIVGYPAPRENEPGHDLTYLADYGLLTPPDLPRTLLADLAGAERAASAALGLLLARERGFGAGYTEVPLSEAAEAFAAPLRHGITRPGELLGGGFPGYGVYRTSDGWVAVAALEAHFLEKLLSEFGLEKADKEEMERIFAEHPASWWEKWAGERDLPVAAII